MFDLQFGTLNRDFSQIQVPKKGSKHMARSRELIFFKPQLKNNKKMIISTKYLFSPKVVFFLTFFSAPFLLELVLPDVVSIEH